MEVHGTGEEQRQPRKYFLSKEIFFMQVLVMSHFCGVCVCSSVGVSSVRHYNGARSV